MQDFMVAKEKSELKALANLAKGQASNCLQTPKFGSKGCFELEVRILYKQCRTSWSQEGKVMEGRT